jgi:hypothetical protein
MYRPGCTTGSFLTVCGVIRERRLCRLAPKQGWKGSITLDISLLLRGTRTTLTSAWPD